MMSVFFKDSVSLAESLVVLFDFRLRESFVSASFLAGRDVAPRTSDASSTSTFLFFRLLFFCFVIACENALLVSASEVVVNVAIVSVATASILFYLFSFRSCNLKRFRCRFVSTVSNWAVLHTPVSFP